MGIEMFGMNPEDLESMVGMSMQEKMLGPEAHQESIKHAQVHRAMLEQQVQMFREISNIKKAQAGLLLILSTIIMVSWALMLIMGSIWFVTEVILNA